MARTSSNPVLWLALALMTLVAAWGLWDADHLAATAKGIVHVAFKSRGWFIMLTATTLLIGCTVLAFSPYGRIKLGADDDEPEFSNTSWISMLFAAGMGVGLLYWGAAEPATHFLLIKDYYPAPNAAEVALFITNFHWGLHAWAIYAMTALVIAYFSFRKGCATLIGAPIRAMFGHRSWARALAALGDFFAIAAIAIGLGGSVALGVFQVQEGLGYLLNTDSTGMTWTIAVFGTVCVSFLIPLTLELSKGMALLSNIAMAAAGALVVFILLAGPTHYIMNGVVESVGAYFSEVLQQGFRTYTFFDQRIENWFESWTLTYMVWWLAWAPFVGVFIARISKGRTIREFLLGVILVPTAFSIIWFGVFGGFGFYEALKNQSGILEVVQNNVSSTTFFLLDRLPLPKLTIFATLLAAFLFVVTSVVSAAFVLSMFSTNGNLNPATKVKLVWGVILALLGLVMILSGNVDAVKSIIALGALPFIYFVLILMVCLLKSLKQESIK